MVLAILFLAACESGVMKKEIKLGDATINEEFGVVLTYSPTVVEEEFNESFDDVNIEITYVSLSYDEEIDQNSVGMSFNITNESTDDIKYRIQDIKLSTETLDKVEVKDYGVLETDIEDVNFISDEIELKPGESRAFTMSWLINEDALELEWAIFHLADINGKEVAEVKYIFD